MVFDLSQIDNLGSFTKQAEKSRTLYFRGAKVFLVVNKTTIEIRTDHQLAENLKSKYESVMESRYFGRGGIEIVLAGQLTPDELADLVRLSYHLTV